MSDEHFTHFRNIIEAEVDEEDTELQFSPEALDNLARLCLRMCYELARDADSTIRRPNEMMSRAMINHVVSEIYRGASSSYEELGNVFPLRCPELSSILDAHVTDDTPEESEGNTTTSDAGQTQECILDSLLDALAIKAQRQTKMSRRNRSNQIQQCDVELALVIVTEDMTSPPNQNTTPSLSPNDVTSERAKGAPFQSLVVDEESELDSAMPVGTPDGFELIPAEPQENVASEGAKAVPIPSFVLDKESEEEYIMPVTRQIHDIDLLAQTQAIKSGERMTHESDTESVIAENGASEGEESFPIPPVDSWRQTHGNISDDLTRVLVTKELEQAIFPREPTESHQGGHQDVPTIIAKNVESKRAKMVPIPEIEGESEGNSTLPGTMQTHGKNVRGLSPQDHVAKVQKPEFGSGDPMTHGSHQIDNELDLSVLVDVAAKGNGDAFLIHQVVLDD